MTVTEDPTKSEVAAMPQPATVMTTNPGRAQLACDLGDLILDQLPYGSKIAFPVLTIPSPTPLPVDPEPKLPNGYKATNRVERDGLYADKTAAAPYLPGPMLPSNGQVADKDMNEGGLLKHWESHRTSHQVTKTIRIWYRYEVPGVPPNPDDSPVTAGTWLLVGYVGDGHG